MGNASKAVADSVHGTIELTPLEIKVIGTRAFQRLRNVKQLGLAHMVFPGADYSRFSHSLGVCHVTGRIVNALNKRQSDTIPPGKVDLFRMAGLLHDVGHYPFSHAMEDVLKKKYYSSGVVERSPIAGTPTTPTAATSVNLYADHETVGAMTLTADREIHDLLSGNGIEPEHVIAILTHDGEHAKLANMISSDLDADRIDYLMRTARHTGLPYGTLDLEYLLSQFCLDKDNHLCVHPKALRAVEHALLGRYFDYQQVSYHKTVAGLELVLKDVLGILVDRKELQLSRPEIDAQLSSATWPSIDDSFVFEKIRLLDRESEDPVVRTKAQAILRRQAPKMVGKIETLALRDEKTAERWEELTTIYEREVANWAAEFAIPTAFWYPWAKTELGLNKVAVHPTPDTARAASFPKKKGQLVRILNPKDNSSTEIFKLDHSLMSVLGDHALFAFRVYVLMNPEDPDKRQRIEDRVRRDMGR